MNFCFNPIINLSDQGKEITAKLKMWAFIYLGFCLTKMLLFGVGNIFNELLTFFLIVLTFVQLSYFMAVFSLFFLCFQVFFDFITFALLAQDYFLELIRINGIVIIIVTISLLISIALINYTFKAYREYKALYLEQSGIGQYSRLNDIGNNNRLEMNNQPNDNSNTNRIFVPFSGQGATWG